MAIGRQALRDLKQHRAARYVAKHSKFGEASKVGLAWIDETVA